MLPAASSSALCTLFSRASYNLASYGILLHPMASYYILWHPMASYDVESNIRQTLRSVRKRCSETW
jgi:hypothetical protein